VNISKDEDPILSMLGVGISIIASARLTATIEATAKFLIVKICSIQDLKFFLYQNQLA